MKPQNAAALIGASMLLSACTPAESAAGGEDGAGWGVVASTSIVADVVQNVAVDAA